MTEPVLHEETRRLFELAVTTERRSFADTPLDIARAAAKERVKGMDIPAADVASVTDFVVPAGSHDIPVRLYVPASLDSQNLFLYFHGGGFVAGDLNSHDSLCRTLANRLGLRVLAVDYRLAPEHPFPAAVDDAITVAAWCATAPRELGAPVAGAIVGGDSAGGNIAAALAGAWTAELPLRLQILLYPGLDMSQPYQSQRDFAEGYLLTKVDMDFFSAVYRSGFGDLSDPRLSPLHAPAATLPPTIMVTGGLDILRDEGRAYAAKLVTAGVECHYLEATGFPHGFASMRQLLPSSMAVLEQALAVAETRLRAS